MSAFGVSEFYIRDIFHEFERIQITIRTAAGNFSVETFCLLNLCADFILACSHALKDKFFDTFQML